MFTRFCLPILTLLLMAPACHGLEVAAVLSSPAQPYATALQAFSRHLRALPPLQDSNGSHRDLTIRPITLSSEEQPDALRLEISVQKPDLLLVLGSKAFRLTAPIHDIPIIYLLVPSPHEIAGPQANITGVLLQPEAGAQFHLLGHLMPTLKRVGVIYDPDTTGDLVDQAAATNRGLVFVRRPTRSPQAVAKQLTALTGQIDLLWMVPDSTILSPQTEKIFYRFAHQHRIPILACSEKYLTRGATFATHLDLAAMGRLAALLARQIEKGEEPHDLPPSRTGQVIIKINRALTDKLGLKLQEAQP